MSHIRCFVKSKRGGGGGRDDDDDDEVELDRLFVVLFVWHRNLLKVREIEREKKKVNRVFTTH